MCDPAAAAFGEEPSMIVAPIAPFGRSNSNGAGRVDRHARVVRDIEQVEHLGRFFDRLDHDARFGAKDDVALHRRSVRLRRRRLRRIGRNQHETDAAARRRLELLRFEMLARHLGAGLHRRAWRHVVELRAPGLVRLCGQHLVADAQLNRLVGDVVGQFAADHAHGDRSVRQVGDWPRDAGHLLRVRHLELATYTATHKGHKGHKGHERDA